ncbi:uncharacterized protein LOC128712292 [Anopheles marshallii]|uniref:uncharacterized protein LOC128712292 n=1 Tax=Anopheles marshallii TaxID=1521116 RepID=UPI00237AC18C|nr:uncharacterized protein LOC128712292 [Anopheles marshallii]
MKFTIVQCFVILVAVVSTYAEENDIRCYSCDDCTKQAPTIVKCDAKNGLDLNALSYNPTYPVLTPSTPPWNANPWDPLLTPPPLNGGGNQFYPWDPLLTPPPLVGGNNGGVWYPGYPVYTLPPLNGGGNQFYPWDPLLTPPPLVGGNNGGVWYPGYPVYTLPPLNGGGNQFYPWDPLLTPPPIYYPWGKAKAPSKGMAKRFVCATIRSKGKDQEVDTVHRRGCAEIEGYAVGVCDQNQLPVPEGGITSCRVCGHSLCNE